MGKLILVHGPSFSGRTIECMMAYAHGIHVNMRELMKAKPQSSLRQLLNIHVVAPLQRGDDIILEGCGDTLARRASVFNLIHKKVPGVKLTCDVIAPSDAVDQSMWLLQNHLAECALNYHVTCDHSSREWQRVIGNIQNWDELSDPVESNEGFQIVGKTLPIRVQSFWKFDVPALFIQWEALVKQHGTDELNLVLGAATAIDMWYQTNPCGRVLIIQDGVSKATGSAIEKEKHINEIARQITIKVNNCPVYILSVHSPGAMGEYCRPPSPGLVAFLHRVHHVHLHAQGTVYWYSTASHMKLAEHAGVRHIKASRVFSHPNLATTKAGTTRPAMPAMLSSIEYIEPQKAWCPSAEGQGHLQVPLIEQGLGTEESAWVVQVPAGPGRTMYMAFSSHRMLREYADLTRSYLRQITDSTENKIAALSMLKNKGESKQRSKPAEAYELGKHQGGDEDLPEWMKSKRHKAATKAARPGRSTKTRSSSTVYVMSEEELVQTARRVLQQAGEPLPTEAEIAQHRSSRQSTSSASASASSVLSPEKRKVQRLSAHSPKEKNDDLLSALSGPHRRKTPSRKRQQFESSVLDEILDIEESTSKIKVQQPRQETDTSYVAETQLYQTSTQHDFAVPADKDSSMSRKSSPDKNNVFAVPPNRDSCANRKSSSGSSIQTVADSLVLKSSSSPVPSVTSPHKSPGSSSSVKTVADSLVVKSYSSTNSSVPSSNKLQSNQSSTSIKTVSDSFVSKSSSDKSVSISTKMSTRSSTSLHFVSDSLVKPTQSSSSKSKSGTSAETVPDSLVPGSSLSIPSSIENAQKSPTSSKEKTYVSDSLVLETGSSKSVDKSSGDKIESDGPQVIEESPTKYSTLTTGNLKRTTKIRVMADDSDDQMDLSFLDDLI